MTLVVPFDGSDLAEAPFAGATESGGVFDEVVLVERETPKGKREYPGDHG